MLGAITAVAIVLLFGCGVTVPPDAESYDPPASYRAVWDSAVACTGLHTRRFDELHFFVVPGQHSFWSHGEWAGGTTDGQGNITFSGDYQYHPMIVKHEMIHALGIDNHPHVPFEDPCHATWASWHPADTVMLAP